MFLGEDGESYLLRTFYDVACLRPPLLDYIPYFMPIRFELCAMKGRVRLRSCFISLSNGPESVLSWSKVPLS